MLTFQINQALKLVSDFFLQLDPNTLQDTCRYQHAAAVGTKVISGKEVGTIELVYP